MFRYSLLLLTFFLWQAKVNAQVSFPDSAVVIDNVIINGNKVTKPHIIKRELAFQIGDTIKRSELSAKIESSRRNLLNASLFNFVELNTVESLPGHALIMVEVIERWYIFPAPIFELADRNFNTWWLTKDFGRTNYGLYIYKDNFRGRKETVRFLVKHGYTRQYGFAYDIPYVDRKQQNGAGVMFSYSRNHELSYGSLNNKQLFFKDDPAFVREEYASRLRHTYRKGIYSNFTSEVRYNKAIIADTVLSLTSDYLADKDKVMQYFSLNEFFRYDFRNSKSYPLTGFYFDLDLGQVGLGLLKNEAPSFFKVESWIKKYWQITNRFYFSSGFKGKTTTYYKQPYYLQRGLGYGDFIRGYEYYVIDGQHFGLIKTGFKYELIKPRKQKLGFIPTEKFNTFHYAFYTEFFSDAGYVVDKRNALTNPMANELQYGTGIGLHFVTYYDWIFRVEYSVNKLKEGGFFLHFSAPL